MFFILSKTLSFFIQPVAIIGLLILSSFVIRTPIWRVRLRWIATGLFFFFSNDFLANEVMRAWEVPAPAYSSLKPHKLGIVLTGATIPYHQPDDRVYFNRGADRVYHTVELYKRGLIERILISGGSGRLTGENEPEANKFRKAMIVMGVDSTAILIENETRNTYESAVAVKPMLDSLGYSESDCLLITSAFHMRRSLACYYKAGVKLEPFATDFYAHPREFYPDVLLVPKIDAIMIWQKLIREWVGMVAYKLAGYI